MEILINYTELRKRINLSRPTLLKWEKEGRFPKRKVLGKRTIRWVESDINNWIKTNIDELKILENAALEGNYNLRFNDNLNRFISIFNNIHNREPRYKEVIFFELFITGAQIKHGSNYIVKDEIMMEVCNSVINLLSELNNMVTK